MKNVRSFRGPLFVLFTAGILMLSACGPAAPATSPQPTEPPAIATVVPVIEPSMEAAADITLDYSAVAQDVTIETVPAQPASPDLPYWEAGPEYRLLTLQGYTIANHLHKPQIFIYPVADLATANEGMGVIAGDLQALLQTQQTGVYLPFLPIFNAQQVLHTQLEYIDFMSGQGVRFLTQYDQGILPINNYELFYTFQGLTSDRKYYIAAILPVTNPELPDDSQVDESLMDDFQGYLSRMITLLNEQSASSFTPDLNTLDTMISSIEIR